MKRALLLVVASTLLVATAGCRKRRPLVPRDGGLPGTQPTMVVLDVPSATVGTMQPFATAAPTAKPSAATPASPVAIAFADGQTWSGSYNCVQGPTDVVLHITRVTGNDVEAVFDFKVPNAPNGKYRMTGAYAPAGRHLRLEPGAWIVHPQGYGPVPVDATVSADGKSYSGRIDSPGCSDFAVRR
ncbi:MAG TPA: hypothetical protein VF316_15535 [Polyangiaceae bacterium]